MDLPPKYGNGAFIIHSEVVHYSPRIGSKVRPAALELSDANTQMRLSLGLECSPPVIIFLNPERLRLPRRSGRIPAHVESHNRPEESEPLCALREQS